MRQGGRITAAILDVLEKEAKPGVSTQYLNDRAESLIAKYGATSSFKGYTPTGAERPYPAVVCTSMNNEIVHTPPLPVKILQDGDVLSLDFGVFYKGFHTDAAITVGIGNIREEAAKLIEVTRRALEIGIAAVKPGAKLGDIGEAIQKFIEPYGYGVVRDLAGHGIGRELHEEPLVLNYGKAGTGLELKEGMVIAIEPMVVEGDWHIKQGNDGFTFETKDGKLSAHFEHTVAVTKNGRDVLTGY